MLSSNNPIYVFSFLLLWITGSALCLPGEQMLREGRDLALFIAIDDYDSWEDLYVLPEKALLVEGRMRSLISCEHQQKLHDHHPVDEAGEVVVVPDAVGEVDEAVGE